MSNLENNPPFRGGNPDNNIILSVQGKKNIIPDGTFIKAGEEFLPLCKMCVKSPMTCENDSIREIEVPMESEDDPKLEVVGKVRLPSGEMSEDRGLGFKHVDGVKTGFYKTADDLPEPFVCEFFTPKGSG